MALELSGVLKKLTSSYTYLIKGRFLELQVPNSKYKSPPNPNPPVSIWSLQQEATFNL